VRKNDGRGPGSEPLVGPFLERSLQDLVGAEIAVVAEPDGPIVGDDHLARRRAATALALSRAHAGPVAVAYRPDGRPEIVESDAVSSAHGAGITLAVTGSGPLGCDVEPVRARAEADWQGLLGAHTTLARLAGQALGEDADTASTRVWAAMECLQKAGQPAQGPLTLLPSPRPGWTLFSYGELRIATFVCTLRGWADPVVLAILTEGRN
jgi:enediyne polyketide synthase